MNNMEDKELQELFAAKRTTEANLRRQEELRRLIEAQNTRRSRPMWPVWAGTAAAAIALLLLVRPLLQPPAENDGPILVAQTEVPTPTVVGEVPATLETKVPDRPIQIPNSGKTSVPDTHSTHDKSSSIIECTDSILPVIPEAEPAVEPSTEPVIEQQNVAPASRVMRRQSTLLACTEGCKTPEGEAADKRIDINMGNNNPNNAVFYSYAIK